MKNVTNTRLRGATINVTGRIEADLEKYLTESHTQLTGRSSFTAIHYKLIYCYSATTKESRTFEFLRFCEYLLNYIHVIGSIIGTESSTIGASIGPSPVAIIIPKWLLEYVYTMENMLGMILSYMFELRSDICCASLPCTTFELQRKCATSRF